MNHFFVSVLCHSSMNVTRVIHCARASLTVPYYALRALHNSCWTSSALQNWVRTNYRPPPSQHWIPRHKASSMRGYSQCLEKTASTYESGPSSCARFCRDSTRKLCCPLPVCCHHLVRHAGHSHWHNIRHTKGAKDKEKSAITSRIARKIQMIIRGKCACTICLLGLTGLYTVFYRI